MHTEQLLKQIVQNIINKSISESGKRILQMFCVLFLFLKLCCVKVLPNKT